jgi:hypothetical protein
MDGPTDHVGEVDRTGPFDARWTTFATSTVTSSI